MKADISDNKKNKKTKLPRGLWVGKVRKAKARIEAEGLTPDDPDCYYPRWYYRIRRVGLPEDRKAMPETVATRAQAVEYGKTELLNALLRVEAEKKMATARVRQQLDDLKARRWCTVGQYIEAWKKGALRNNLQDADSSAGSLRLVLAVGMGWKPAYNGKRLDREGGALLRRVDALPMDKVCMATRKAFVLACQVAAGVAVKSKDGTMDINRDKRNPPPINRTINSALNKAGQLFADKHREEEELQDLLVPWDVVDTFLGARLPVPPKKVGEEIPTKEQVELMLEAWRGLRASDDERAQELALCNEVLRLLGLRSGEMTMARASWLEQKDGRTFLNLINRAEEGWSCKSATPGRLMLGDDLAARLLARCEMARAAGMANPFLLLPMLGEGGYDERKRRAKELPERERLVRREHNEWLKGFIGDVRTRQGNHRLRKYVATRIYWGEIDVHGSHEKAARKVKLYLRHEKEATALLHYIAPRDEQEEAVTDETLAAVRE